MKMSLPVNYKLDAWQPVLLAKILTCAKTGHRAENGFARLVKDWSEKETAGYKLCYLDCLNSKLK